MSTTQFQRAVVWGKYPEKEEGKKKTKETERGSVTVENYKKKNRVENGAAGGVREMASLRASATSEASMLISTVSRCSLTAKRINRNTRLAEMAGTQQTCGLNHAAA